MRRVNLLEYFELAEHLKDAKVRLDGNEPLKAATIFFSLSVLPSKLTAFIDDDNGFSTSKHAAIDLRESVNDWINRYALPNGDYSAELFEKVLDNWSWSYLRKKVDAFRSVFEAECHEVDVYSTEQVSIYKTQALVSRGAFIIPFDYHSEIAMEALQEFNNAGKCLAFDLPTACGFHALRGLEIAMATYLQAFGVNVKRLRSWNMYIQAAKKLIDTEHGVGRPSQ